MLEFYLLGVFIVILLTIIKLAVGFATISSLRAQNMKKLGFYYNFNTGTFTEGKTNKNVLIFTICFSLIVEPLLSWINVAATVWTWFSMLVNKTPVPEAMKEYRYKIAHVNLSKEELDKMGNEIAIKHGVKIAESEEQKEEYILLEKDDYGYVNKHTIVPSCMELHYHYHSPDWDSSSDSIYKYKIDGFIIYAKLIEKKQGGITGVGVEQYEVKDNVILESEITSRRINIPEGIKIISDAEIIDKLKIDIEWHEITYYKLKYWMLGKHPEIITKADYRKCMRQELERIRTGVSKIKEVATKNGYIVKKFEIGGLCVGMSENISAEEYNILLDNYKNVFPDGFYKEHNISEYEFGESQEIEDFLLTQLGDKTETLSEGNR